VQSSNAQSLNAQTSNVNVGDTSLLASDIPISENSSKNFFKQKNAQSSNAQTSNVHIGDTSSLAFNIPISENSSKRLQGINDNEFNISLLEYDHGLRRQI
jgi:hypothetical protein